MEPETEGQATEPQPDVPAGAPEVPAADPDGPGGVLRQLTEGVRDLATQGQATADAGQTITPEVVLPPIPADQIAVIAHGPDFLSLLAIFVLAIFVGYYVVWHVTPALHSPLMAVTNAISSVIIVGALVAAGMAVDNVSTVFGFLAVVLASVNIFGGFLVTRRMLSMFRKKPR